MTTTKSQADKDRAYEESRKLASQIGKLVSNELKGSNLNQKEVSKLFAKVNRELYTNNIKTVQQLNTKEQNEIARLVGNELKTLNKVVNRGARKAAKKVRRKKAKASKAITRKKRNKGIVKAVAAVTASAAATRKKVAINKKCAKLNQPTSWKTLKSSKGIINRIRAAKGCDDATQIAAMKKKADNLKIAEEEKKRRKKAEKEREKTEKNRKAKAAADARKAEEKRRKDACPDFNKKTKELKKAKTNKDVEKVVKAFENCDNKQAKGTIKRIADNMKKGIKARAARAKARNDAKEKREAETKKKQQDDAAKKKQQDNEAAEERRKTKCMEKVRSFDQSINNARTIKYLKDLVKAMEKQRFEPTCYGVVDVKNTNINSKYPNVNSKLGALIKKAEKKITALELIKEQKQRKAAEARKAKEERQKAEEAGSGDDLDKINTLKGLQKAVGTLKIKDYGLKKAKSYYTGKEKKQLKEAIRAARAKEKNDAQKKQQETELIEINKRIKEQSKVLKLQKQNIKKQQVLNNLIKELEICPENNKELNKMKTKIQTAINNNDIDKKEGEKLIQRLERQCSTQENTQKVIQIKKTVAKENDSIVAKVNSQHDDTPIQFFNNIPTNNGLADLDGKDETTWWLGHYDNIREAVEKNLQEKGSIKIRNTTS